MSLAVPENVWTVVVAGGTGTRFGRPKQYEMLGDRRLIDHAVAAATVASEGVVVVVPEPDVESERAHFGEAGVVVAGGGTRSESVRAGLAVVPEAATIICVHDAARPFASDQLFRSVIVAVGAGADGAVPGVPVTDTIKVVSPTGVVEQTPRRDTLVAVQTPQAFRSSTLRNAHAEAPEGTDDAALVESAGGLVVVVPGEAGNRKITHLHDLDWARARIGTSRA